ncbi:MAG: hypothetical protein WAL20_14580, partial [Rhodomicrobium sp.]
KHSCAPHLHGGREIAGFDRQRLRQDREAPDRLGARKAAIDRVDAGLQLLTDRVFMLSPCGRRGKKSRRDWRSVFSGTA